jgi:hypothetical protein
MRKSDLKSEPTKTLLSSFTDKQRSGANSVLRNWSIFVPGKYILVVINFTLNFFFWEKIYGFLQQFSAEEATKTTARDRDKQKKKLHRVRLRNAGTAGYLCFVFGVTFLRISPHPFPQKTNMKSRVVDPDWIRIQGLCGSGSVLGIRIRIQG